MKKRTKKIKKCKHEWIIWTQDFYNGFMTIPFCKKCGKERNGEK